MEVSYKFKKIFINLFAVLLCFAHLNSYAKPITGAFGVKLGSPIMNYEVEKVGIHYSILKKFNSDFFDEVLLYDLPYSKKIFLIKGRKKLCSKNGKQALIDSVKNLYSEHDVLETREGFNKYYDYLIGGKNERYIGVYCLRDSLFIDYFDKNLRSQYSIEQQDTLREQIKRTDL